MTSSPTHLWHARTSKEALSLFAVSAARGMTHHQVLAARQVHGWNQLREMPPVPWWRKVIDQLRSGVVSLLLLACMVAFLLGEWIDAGVIFAIVFLNTLLSVLQEARAQSALRELQKLSTPLAQVLRGGKHISIPNKEVVPGDIVFFESGALIPADVRLVEAVNLHIDESSLTGESQPVRKLAELVLSPQVPLADRKNCVFMGTSVTAGRGCGMVITTGMNTQIGLIATLLNSVEHQLTPLQRKLEQLGSQLAGAALIVCVAIFVLEIVRETPLSLVWTTGASAYFAVAGKQVVELFLLAVSLAIAAVPEGLPAVVTITFALGMRTLVRRHALIRHLPSVETLGSTSVICTDKTGTLTQNQMTVTQIWCDGKVFSLSGTGYSFAGSFHMQNHPILPQQYPGLLATLWAGVLCSDASIEVDEQGVSHQLVGDPTEGAIVVAAAKAAALKPNLFHAYPRLQEIAFDSERKMMTTVCDVAFPSALDPSPFHEHSEQASELFVIATKGAPDEVLARCVAIQHMDNTQQPLSSRDVHAIRQAQQHMATQSLRVLAVAYRVDRTMPSDITSAGLESDLVFLGLIGMIDPPRPEVAAAIASAHQAGMRTIMITGDHADTAEAIGRQIGLLRGTQRITVGAYLDDLAPKEVAKVVAETAIFARVTPQHKLQIVRALQHAGHVVAMTGDGVNDAPALKQADIGVAMGIAGTDVAKQAADMVLTDDNYASIVGAVSQGRTIYANIRKFVYYLLSSNAAEVSILFFAVLLGLPVPLTAIQLLWLNLVTDGAPALALAVEPAEGDVMHQPPRSKTEPLIDGVMRWRILVQTVVQTIVTLGALLVGLQWSQQVMVAETMAFVTLSLSEVWRALAVRSERISLWRQNWGNNRPMLGAVGISLSMLLLVTLVPFLQPFFGTTTLAPREWMAVIALSLSPLVVEEGLKMWQACAGKKNDLCLQIHPDQLQKSQNTVH